LPARPELSCILALLLAGASMSLQGLASCIPPLARDPPDSAVARKIELWMASSDRNRLVSE